MSVNVKQHVIVQTSVNVGCIGYSILEPLICVWIAFWNPYAVRLQAKLVAPVHYQTYARKNKKTFPLYCTQLSRNSHSRL